MTNAQLLVSALVGACQPLEAALMQLLLLRRVDTAEGAQLDVIGAIVGRARDGADDDVYRRRIRAQIATNASDGRTEDLIAITDLVVYDDAALARIETTGVAAVVVHVEGVAVAMSIAWLLIEFLRRAVAAGVRVVLDTLSEAPDDSFTFEESVLGFPGGPGLGFAEYDGSSGGALGSSVA